MSKYKIIYCGIILLGLCSFSNMATIAIGYHKNYEINEINHYKLVEVSRQLKAGQNFDYVNLYKLQNDIYAQEMPYHNGFDFIEAWMKNYYEIPQNTTFRWCNINQRTEFVLIEGNYWSDHWMGDKAVFSCIADEEKTVTLKINSLGELEKAKLFCTVEDNREIYEVSGDNNIIQIQIPAGEHNLTIESEKTFLPSNGDQRALSVNMDLLYE